MPRGDRNQYLLNAPQDELKPFIEQFWRLSIPDTESVQILKEYYDTDVYSLRFRRRIYHAAGVYDMWCLDQHNKFQKFGLQFHNAIDPFNSCNVWMHVWWTNKNLVLIKKFYLDAVRRDGDNNCGGYIPMTLMSDPGSENFGVANMHTEIRQRLDSGLRGTLQHRFMRKRKNIKSEANWSIYHRDFAPGFEDLFLKGLLSGDYDPDDPLEWYVLIQILGEK
ncbi:hypothetical protein K435DRAFT_806624 [Dendrothele bispora CBS 962.96]|uniref:Integrase core domain-containing protein n=1 Tax=Dendrothele bispora (strain CBS 962.96) TaxID=1314807 RepID=A0A4S8L7N3_DENBC|nr:hypothetical protein K435DRAFT_806624 [Dendrothele bispora CBS 962.96]